MAMIMGLARATLHDRTRWQRLRPAGCQGVRCWVINAVGPWVFLVAFVFC